MATSFENERSEPDGDEDDDSAYGDSVDSASETTSITPSKLNYKWENGRRYHAYHEGEYLLPNDDEEQDRMDHLHYIYGLLLPRLHLAPIDKNPQHVLDLGTGTGSWAIEFADEYPSAEVIGNDLSPIQPQWVPPNCYFEVDDFEADWTYARSFDYIHGRELAGAVKDFDRLFKQAFTNLRPGGYLEMQSFCVDLFSDDGSLDEKGTYTRQLVKLIHKASTKFGKVMANMNEWPQKMSVAGFEEVRIISVKVPMNAWPEDPYQKLIGNYMREQQHLALPAYALALLSRVLNWKKEDIDELVEKVKAELMDPSIHQYSKMHVIYGRRPLRG